MRYVAIIPARMTSSRLPRKALAPIAGEPMLARLVERVRASERLQGIVVATSTDREDDPIADLCRSRGISVFRGDRDDVLGRVNGAAAAFEAEGVVELMGDSPLVSGDLIDQTIRTYETGDFDYVCSYTNTVRLEQHAPMPTYPTGLWSQVFSAEALRTAAAETDDPFYREHSSSYFFKNPDRWRLGYLHPGRLLNRPDLFLAVNLPEHLELVRAIFDECLPSSGRDFSLARAVQAADHYVHSVRHHANHQR